MSNIAILPIGNTRPALPREHFPLPYQAVIWRNWGMVPRERLARILACSEEQLVEAAAAMGLKPQDDLCDIWLQRGYQTIIRQNWHTLTYEQILIALDWTPEKLELILREDDFFWHKLGFFKPIVEAPRYTPLNAEQAQATAQLHRWRDETLAALPPQTEAPFAFLRQRLNHAAPTPAAADGGLRMIYSYSALYGDPLLDSETDPFPDSLLADYAAAGVNALWMQAVLYLLVPWFGDTPYSAQHEVRIENLRKLVARMRKHGLKLILYLNEPRAMPEPFFQYHPDWRGCKDSSDTGLHALCTSLPEVREKLSQGVEKLFRLVPDLGGLFCISMSENLTNCWSRSVWLGSTTCPRCNQRPIADVVAEVINAINDGARRGKPDAEVIAWNWAWRNTWDADVLRQLPENIKIMCVSETSVPTHVGGIDGTVSDYSISKPGPGPVASRLWDLAKARGLDVVAKVQLNNTWENSAVPYLPVPDLVEEHLQGLRAKGIHNFMLSWTLGGYPGGNIRLLHHSKEELAQMDFGAAAPDILRAYHCFSEAFRHFPLHHTIQLYTAPQNFGPHTLLYDSPTGYCATMVGFPYDDLKTWRGGDHYPEDVFENAFRLISEGWQEGLDILRRTEAAIAPAHRHNFEDLWRVAEASYCHFRSSYLQIAFVRRRQAKDRQAMRDILHEEITLAQRLLAVMNADSRIGFEASNHYYYTRNSIIEKILNCRHLLAKLDDSK
ncbi:MAG: hypothetical protein GX945_09805 [Lentisphaerae bacterium]|nr:hypothetical protein [Lentisphaerota bacterium]